MKKKISITHILDLKILDFLEILDFWENFGFFWKILVFFGFKKFLLKVTLTQFRS